MSFTLLRPQIVALLKNRADKLHSVSVAPDLQSSGYPFAYVVPAEVASEYETRSENERVYAFTIRAFYETKNTKTKDALRYLEATVDQIIDVMDQEDMRSADRVVGKDLGANYQFLNIFAHPAGWGTLEEENLIMAEIACKVRISVDVEP